MASPPPGARFDAMPAVAMAAAPAGGGRNKAAVMEDDMGGAYSKAPAAPSDKKEAIVLNEDVNQDFQKVKIGARDYSHTLRPGWNKLGSRIDFTQTLLFNSAQKLLPTQDGKQAYQSKFNLNDQVSSFVVTVNVFSSKGKFAF